MTKPLKQQISQLVDFHRNILNSIGADPYVQNSGSRIRKIAMYITMVHTFIMILLSVPFNFTVDQIQMVIEIAPVVLHNITKSTTIILNCHNILDMMEDIYSYWNSVELDEIIKQELADKFKQIRRWYYKYFVLLSLVFLTFLTRPLFELPIRILGIPWVPMCDYYNNWCYIFVYILDINQAIYTSLTLMGPDLLFLLMTQLGVLRMEAVKYSFKQVMVEDDDYWTKFSKAVDEHSKALEFFRKIEKVYCIIALDLLWMILVVIAISIFKVSMDGFPPSSALIYKYSVFMGMQIFLIYTYCRCGQTVSDVCDSVAEVTYDINWWNIGDTRLRKGIARVIEISQWSFNLTAGKVFYLNIETFSVIIKNATSFCTVLQTFYTTNED